MSSITHRSDGTITIKLNNEEECIGDDRLTAEQMAQYLRAIGYIIIDANHVAYCHYVSGECPHCGRPAERTGP